MKSSKKNILIVLYVLIAAEIVLWSALTGFWWDVASTWWAENYPLYTWTRNIGIFFGSAIAYFIVTLIQRKIAAGEKSHGCALFLLTVFKTVCAYGMEFIWIAFQIRSIDLSESSWFIIPEGALTVAYLILIGVATLAELCLLPVYRSEKKKEVIQS